MSHDHTPEHDPEQPEFESVTEISAKVRKAMAKAEAQECGLIPDDSTTCSEVPDKVLEFLGLTKEEVSIEDDKPVTNDIRAPISLEYIEAHSYSNFDENGYTIMPKELDCEEDDIYDVLYPDGRPNAEALRRWRKQVKKDTSEPTDGTQHLPSVMEQKRMKQEAIAVATRFAPKAKAIFPEGEVWLFGSYAKGYATKASDIDIAIILPERHDVSTKEAREAYFKKTAALGSAADDTDERIGIVVRSVQDQTGFVKAIFDTGIYIA